MTTNLPFLRWLVAHPAFRYGDVSTDFLTRYPPLSSPPLPAPPGPWDGAWRLNLPPRPLLGATRGRGGGAHRLGAAPAATGASTAPMPGKVIDVRVEEGDAVESHQPLVVLEAMKMEQVVTAPYDAGIRSVDVRVGDQVTIGGGSRHTGDGMTVLTTHVARDEAFAATRRTDGRRSSRSSASARRSSRQAAARRPSSATARAASCRRGSASTGSSTPARRFSS